MQNWLAHEGGRLRPRRGLVAGAVAGAAVLLASVPAGAAYGTSWTQDGTTQSVASFAAVSCVDGTGSATTCLAVGFDIKNSLNSEFGAAYTYGATTGWTQQVVPNTIDDLKGVSCVVANYCIAVGFKGSIAKVTSGGTSWTKLTSPSASAILRGVTCTSVGNCIAVGEDASAAVIYRMVGGGAWTSIAIPAGQSLADVSCSSPITLISGTTYSGTCVASAYGGRLDRTTNGGTTWTQAPAFTPAAFDLLGVSCNTSDVCVSVSNGGEVVKSVAGGAWSRYCFSNCATTPNYYATDSLTDVSCSGAMCEAVGYRGLALTSSDSGATWTTKLAPAVFDMLGVSCTATKCRAAGNNGTYSSLGSPGVFEKT